MDESLKCARGAPPVVRLALKREKCPRAGTRLTSPEKIVEYLKSEYGCEAQEWFIAVGLNTQGHALGIHEIALGGMASTEVDPKVLFAGLLLMGASSFVICHNHPSGSPQPSMADEQLTRSLKQGAEILAIRLLDHIIVSGNTHLSFQQQGLLSK